jgi:hypothetical protein
MNKGKTSGAAGAMTGQAVTLGTQTVLGGLCGVGLVWTLNALWPPSRRLVDQFGDGMQNLAQDYPVVLLGLLIGVLGALTWNAVKR